MRNYKPTAPFTVPMRLLIPTTTKSKGVVTKTYSDPDDSELIMGSFRTFGGTEDTDNGVVMVHNTATIDTWYRPDITSDCQIYLIDTEQTYDIISEPENINMRGQYTQFRVQLKGGKA